MEINLNKGVSSNLLTNNSGYLRNKKIGFSVNPSAALNLEKKVSGGFWGLLAEKVPEWSFASNFSKKIIGMASSNPALVEAAFVLGLSTTLRPASIMVVPGPPKDDRKYAAAKSIATGIIGFAFTAAAFIPIAAATKHLGELAKNNVLKNGFPAAGSNKYKVAEYLFNYVPRFVVAPLEAMALFAMVPPIVHKFLDKKPKQAAAPSLPLQPKTAVTPDSKSKV